MNALPFLNLAFWASHRFKLCWWMHSRSSQTTHDGTSSLLLQYGQLGLVVDMGLFFDVVGHYHHLASKSVSTCY